MLFGVMERGEGEGKKWLMNGLDFLVAAEARLRVVSCEVLRDREGIVCSMGNTAKFAVDD